MLLLILHSLSKLVFDIGFNVGGDTHNYLKWGHRVVAVEGNAHLIHEKASQQPFKDAIDNGRLILLHSVIARKGGRNMTFWESMTKAGEISSLNRRNCKQKDKHCVPVLVPALSCEMLMQSYGIPHYVKVDIEGADHVCVESIVNYTNHIGHGPKFMSAESVSLYLLHIVAQAGYTSFKCSDQVPYWTGGSSFDHAIGSSSGPFGDGLVDKYTNSSTWRQLRPFIEMHDHLATGRVPHKYQVTASQGKGKCSKSDMHWRRDTA